MKKVIILTSRNAGILTDEINNTIQSQWEGIDKERYELLTCVTIPERGGAGIEMITTLTFERTVTLP
ncbi:hypothetical protein Molly5_162 [Maribacter phage Molly_5]|uniref:Uncharacterized protein n=1 Tax=Maribacter phage Molly_1 TaxID=2745685 RepID=A0A8E4XXX9_9CAUD|nr:hypothetical protein M1M29_gp162 [Maribacter phage Molly_1]QQO97658.1 hypothetical protein Molly2_162 [Maribacter phage Molly_2]QQO97858.1 hypothetical protein Molly3_162 [Maribacter phage Molly_3]QQO98058.1 hypothetical protein Molly4_162 [Maribacter phage Molly_4]QQO98258.1 hypothetical protein Molly5_162 [Maribacter phage Molly_5]QQO97458.1 hypothetical protein Molly1_162 [Maribacter phage Molly_1]